MKLPLDIDEVFATYFDRWYTPDARERNGFEHSRPDMMACYKPGTSMSDICRLTGNCCAEVERRVVCQLSPRRSIGLNFFA